MGQNGPGQKKFPFNIINLNIQAELSLVSFHFIVACWMYGPDAELQTMTINDFLILDV